VNVRRFTVIDPATPDAPAGVRCLAEFPDEPPPAYLLLGVKPQSLADVAPHVAARIGAQTSLLSILAGSTRQTLADTFPDVRQIVRIMPNLPVAIGHGVVALHAPGPRADLTALMMPLGLVEWIDDERLFDAVTALSGSGPAFLYRFAQALADGARAMGLKADVADRLARATLAGAALTARESPLSLADLADRVASKGGSTRSGLDVLDADDALNTLMAATLAAAERRNAELAQLSG
jgi:pyrroline-5-carboxylate reductase